MRFVILAVLTLSGCGTHKSWQEACFERISPQTRPGLLGGTSETPAFNPQLTTRTEGGRRIVYCDK